LVLDAVQHTLAQKSEPSLAVHHALDEFNPGYVSLNLSIIDLQG
jgi:hypothetical protein